MLHQVLSEIEETSRMEYKATCAVSEGCRKFSTFFTTSWGGITIDVDFVVDFPIGVAFESFVTISAYFAYGFYLI